MSKMNTMAEKKEGRESIAEWQLHGEILSELV